MRNKLLAALIVLLFVFGGTLLVGLLAVAFTDTGQGMFQLAIWDRTSTLSCRNGLIELEDEQIALGGSVLRIANGCRARLINCRLSGTLAVLVEDGGVLEMEGGELDGTITGLSVDDGGFATIREARILGAIRGLYVNKESKVEIFDSDIRGTDHGVFARSKSDVRISGCDIRGTKGLEVQGSTVMIQGGEIHGTGAAILARGKGTTVTVNDDTTIVGKVKQRGPARVETGARSSVIQVEAGIGGTEAEQRARQQARNNHYAAQACEGVVECYQANGFAGVVAASITMKVNDEGEVTSAKANGVPSDSRSCVDEITKSKRLREFDGPGGTLICAFKGKIGPVAVELDIEPVFKPHK